MYENKFGNRFVITSFGESHSKASGVLIEGIKANIDINIEDIQKLLDSRKAKSKYHTKRKEEDKIEILSGIFNEKTLGSPILALVYNKNTKSKDYKEIKDIFRPSHADFTFFKKYGIRDYRGGGRASARETVSRVIAGSIALDFLKKKNIKIESKIIQVGNIIANYWDKLQDKDIPFSDNSKVEEIKKYLDSIKGDSIGGIVETRISGIKNFLGDPIFEKLDANISKAIISIPAAKGIEFGKGFIFSFQKASLVNDQMNENGFLSNNSGGIQGGISNTQDIIFRTIFKATPSISKEQNTINKNNDNIKITIKGRHDPALVLRTIPIINSMAALVLQDAIQEDEISKIKNNNNLDSLRKDIQNIDNIIFEHLSKRFIIAKEIAQEKEKNNINIENKIIEENLINRFINLDLENLDDEFIKNIYKIIFKKSKELQKKLNNLK